MDGAVFSIIIQAVKRGVFCNPVGNFLHVFIFNPKIYRSSQAWTDRLVFTVQFMDTVLIKPRGYAVFNVFTQFK
jgi:hypothetical protein